MSSDERFTAAEWHRHLAVSLFNETWVYLEKSDRSDAETDRMLHMAHASRYHWEQVGEAVNLARGEWQVSRVHAVAGQPEGALYHGRRCLEILDDHGIGDWDRAAALEAIARAHMVAGDAEKMAAFLEQARAACQSIADPQDRAVVEGDLESIRMP